MEGKPKKNVPKNANVRFTLKQFMENQFILLALGWKPNITRLKKKKKKRAQSLKRKKEEKNTLEQFSLHLFCKVVDSFGVLLQKRFFVQSLL